MFDNKLPATPAFFEFVSPVFFDGVGYVDKVALSPEFVDAKCPAVDKYIAAADGYLFVLESGGSTCVSSANVKFLAGKLVGVVERARDGKKEGIRGKSVASDSGEGHERQKATQEVPPSTATPSKLPTQQLKAPVAPNATPAPKGPQPKRRGAW